MVPFQCAVSKDLSLSTAINASAPSEHAIKYAVTGDYLTVHLESPGGGLLFSPPILAAQLFTTGAPLSTPTGFPDVHLNPNPGYLAANPIFVIYDPFSPLIGSGFLPPRGMSFGFQVSPGMQGTSAMFQGFAFDPTAQNTIFSATDGHEIWFGP